MQDFFLLRLEHFEYALAPQGRIQLITKGGFLPNLQNGPNWLGKKALGLIFPGLFKFTYAIAPQGRIQLFTKGGFGPILKYGPNWVGKRALGLIFPALFKFPIQNTVRLTQLYSWFSKYVEVSVQILDTPAKRKIVFQ